jgi:hypothetical protein
MPDPSPEPSPGSVFVRVLVAGLMISGAVGFPAIGPASSLSGRELGVVSVLGALVVAAAAAAITVLFIRTVVRQIWTAWVGLLSGVIPASLAAPRSRLVALALAHLGAGALLVVNGLRLLVVGADAASATWAFYGMTSALTGLGLGLGGALPRLWWVWRRGGVEQPDDTVSRHLGLFAWLALTALSMSSGLAETLPGKLDPSGVPLRRGDWERACASTNSLSQDICPRERRHVLRVRRPERTRVEWELSSESCEIVVDDGEPRRTFDDRDGFVRLATTPERAVEVTVVALDIEGCWFALRARPEPEDR